MASEEKNVLNIDNFRSEKIKLKKRKTQRLFFEDLLTCYLVSPSKKLTPIAIIEASEEGFSFSPLTDIKLQDSHFSVRWYLSNTIYFETQAKIIHAHETITHQKSELKYGCQVDQKHYCHPTYVNLIKLVQSLSEISQEDRKRVF
jgi:hypothetical protein